MPDLVGSTLGRYRIIRQIGQGGMATVYEAYQPALDRYVAIKVLPSYFAHEQNFSERFWREATAIAKLEHPNILPVHDYGEENDIPYLVMKYVPGGTLKSRMDRPLSLADAVKIVDQIAAALEYAHQRGVVHRDIKPSNILLTDDDWVLLSDFGIAKILGASATLTKQGVGMGTPEYMAPEQGMGQSDQRSDIYSLGVVLYEMLTGTPPFVADTPLAVILKHINEPLPLPSTVNPNLPKPVERVILKALAKRPEERHQSAAEMATALREAANPYLEQTETALGPAVPADVGDTTDVVWEEAATGTMWEWIARPRNLVLLAAGTALVVILLVSAGMIVARGWIGQGSSAARTPGAETTAGVAQMIPPVGASPASVTGPKTYFVSPNGSDGGPGTMEQPWSSIQRAVDTLQPGDTLYLRGGVYHQSVTLPRSGTKDRPLTIAAYPGEEVWLDGEGANNKYGFSLDDARGVAYINIAGLNMRNWHDAKGDGACIVSWQSSAYVTIRDAELHHCGSSGIGFMRDSHYVTVENVRIHDNALIGMDCGEGPCIHWVLRRVSVANNGAPGAGSAADGIAVESGDDILVEDCESVGNAGDGFDFKSSNTTLLRVTSANQGGVGIKLWGKNSRIENSISTGNQWEALALMGGGSYTVANSLFGNTRQYGYTAGFGYDFEVPTPVTLLNNIFSTTSDGNGGTLILVRHNVELQADHNLYYAPNRTEDVICWDPGDRCFGAKEINDDTWTQASGQDAHSRYAAPLFQNEPAGDFYPTQDSPTVDAGTCAGAPPVARDGGPRPKGDSCDIGPFEY